MQSEKCTQSRISFEGNVSQKTHLFETSDTSSHAKNVDARRVRKQEVIIQTILCPLLITLNTSLSSASRSTFFDTRDGPKHFDEH